MVAVLSPCISWKQHRVVVFKKTPRLKTFAVRTALPGKPLLVVRSSFVGPIVMLYGVGTGAEVMVCGVR